MIERSVFLRLNLKQRIYKTAQLVREFESRISAGEDVDLKQIRTYRDYLDLDSHDRAKTAVAQIDQLLKSIAMAYNVKEKLMQFNFCFHSLMKSNNSPVDEEDFLIIPRQFDKNIKTHISGDSTTAAILDNLRSPFNVGSIFRSADVFGCPELALCGITPHPPGSKIEKAAMGTSEFIHWRYFEDTSAAIDHYRSSLYKIAAVETVKTANPLYAVEDFGNTAFVFGNEEFGITEEILSKCDYCIEIPQLGVKNSMNVANCFSVVMYEVLRRKAAAGR